MMVDDMPEPLESSTEIMTVTKLVDRVTKTKKIDLNPIYQRDVVWSEIKMSGFIDSLMRGYIPSNITMNYETGTKKWTCIDGKQRIMSILNFCKNAIPWIRDDGGDDDLQIVYFGEVPDGKKDNKNCFHLSSKQQDEFLEKSVIIVSYNDLDYNMQCEIFNRIQNSMSATSGEQAFSIFRNPEVASKFKEFCRTHDYTKKARFRNVDMLLSMMYMKKTKELKMLSGKKEKKKFITDLDDMNEYVKIIKLVEKHLTVFFNDELMGHKEIVDKNMTKNFIMVMFFLLSKETTKLADLEEAHLPRVRRMLIKIWDKWNIVDGDINKERSKTSVKVLQKIQELYEENSTVMNNLDDDTVYSSDENEDNSNDNDESDEENETSEEESEEETDNESEEESNEESEEESDEESDDVKTKSKTSVKGKQTKADVKKNNKPDIKSNVAKDTKQTGRTVIKKKH